MEYLRVGIALVAILMIAMHHRIVEINFNLLQMHANDIAIWLLKLTLGLIITYFNLGNQKGNFCK